MKAPIIIKKDEIKTTPLLFGGKEGDSGNMSMPIKPPEVDSKGMVMGTAEVNPGFSAHAWHTHEKCTTFDKTIEVIYPKDFEELYYILSGSGIVQWEGKDDKIEEVEVGPGDILFFPVGVASHQLLNTGSKKMTMVWMGTPADVEFRQLGTK